jgi:opacity protein-like surface antigen
MLRYDLGYFRVNGRPLDFIALEAGVSVDIRLRATEDVDADYEVTTSRWNFFSMTANGGVHFALSDHWGVGARFMYSVVPCRFTGNPGWFYNQYYNKVVQFCVTYNINSPLR